MSVRPIILLEFNEVPWRVIDHCLTQDRYPHISRFFASARTYTSVSDDSGELSPWVTWPSLHRGMNNAAHGVKMLGQEPSTFSGVPIWQEFRKAGLPIGICGSMQSWPAVDPGPGGFYVPDTFAKDERCYPTWIEPLQKFNLAQVQKNARVVNVKSLTKSEMVRVGMHLPRFGIRARTLSSLALQVAAERVTPARSARRPIFQALLFWDLFRKLYRPREPVAFATFFTNHVAGMMHRYWHSVFPQDYPVEFLGRLGPPETEHVKAFEFGLEILDGMVSDVLEMAAVNPEIIIVLATSMGQAAVQRDQHRGYDLTIPDIIRLLAALGERRDGIRPLMAMAPQVVAEIEDGATRVSVTHKLLSSRTESGVALFRCDEIGSTLSISYMTPSQADWDAGGFTFESDGTKHRVQWQDAGIGRVETTPGTAYHVPEGVVAVFDPKTPCSEDSRTVMPLTRVKALLMELAGTQLANLR